MKNVAVTRLSLVSIEHERLDSQDVGHRNYLIIARVCLAQCYHTSFAAVRRQSEIVRRLRGDDLTCSDPVRAPLCGRQSHNSAAEDGEVRGRCVRPGLLDGEDARPPPGNGVALRQVAGMGGPVVQEALPEILFCMTLTSCVCMEYAPATRSGASVHL